VLPSVGMSLVRPLGTIMIVAVLMFGPALFMASSPCLDCDGVCGVAAIAAPIEIESVLCVLPLKSDLRAQIPLSPVLLSELPPRPLLATV